MTSPYPMHYLALLHGVDGLQRPHQRHVTDRPDAPVRSQKVGRKISAVSAGEDEITTTSNRVTVLCLKNSNIVRTKSAVVRNGTLFNSYPAIELDLRRISKVQ